MRIYRGNVRDSGICLPVGAGLEICCSMLLLVSLFAWNCSAEGLEDDGQHWSFRPLRDSGLPSVSDDRWLDGPIDAFVLARLDAVALSPGQRADRRTLIRRLSFDLIGLPPTLAESGAAAGDPAPDAISRVVDRLLASPHFGERWARHWLDVARYGEDVRPNGFQTRPLANAYKYRDWVIDAFNQDLPYEEFVVQQIAGDLVTPESQAGRIAVGFLALGQIYESDAGGKESKLKAQFDTIDDKVDAITRGFLGLTVACARCHDHKFDPISVEDYYGLAGVLSNTVTVEEDEIHTLSDSAADDIPIAIGGNPNNPGRVVPRRFLRILSGPEAPVFRAGSGRLAFAKAIVTDGQSLAARVMTNRLWHHLFGRGLVASPSNFGHLGESPTHPELLDWLALRFIETNGSVKAILREIVLSRTYQLNGHIKAQHASIDTSNEWLWRREPKRLEAEAWRDGILAVTGQLDRRIGGPSDPQLLEGRRRTIYGAISRAQDFPSDNFLLTFDFPDPNITVGRRTRTTIPQQQLFALNSPFMISQARKFAARIKNEFSGTEDRLTLAFQLCYGRSPRQNEMQLAQQFLKQQKRLQNNRMPRSPALTPWELMLQAMLASNEMMYLR